MTNIVTLQIELQKEVRVLEKSRAHLEKMVLEAVSHLRVLHDSKQRLQDDIRDKVRLVAGFCISIFFKGTFLKR